jgi:hypothetical protein
MADGFCIGQLNSYGMRHRVRAQFHIGGLERPLRMVDFAVNNLIRLYRSIEAW